MIKKIVLVLIISLFSIFGLFYAVKLQNKDIVQFPLDVKTMNDLSVKNITNARQTRSIAVNNIWESRITNPENIAMVFMGTSRTKFVRPNAFFSLPAVIAGGNSYNEISYGLLLEAEVLRRRFPNARTFFIESSLLLRRGRGLYAEVDHLRYLDLFGEISPLVTELYSDSELKKFLEKANNQLKLWDLSWVKESRSLKISTLLSNENEGAEFKKFLNGEIGSLTEHGEYPVPSETFSKIENLPPPLKEENPKVQRIANSSERIPGNGLFEIILKWALNNKIKVVFYEPPVRSDLYNFKVKFGVNKHKEDLISLVEKYSSHYLDLNFPQNGISDHWEFFSDEDHVNTCAGSYLYTKALIEGSSKMEKEMLRHLKWDFHEDITKKSWSNLCGGT